MIGSWLSAPEMSSAPRREIGLTLAVLQKLEDVEAIRPQQAVENHTPVGPQHFPIHDCICPQHLQYCGQRFEVNIGVMRFAGQIKERQIEWARVAAKSQFLEEKRPWVLRQRFNAENLFDPSWTSIDPWTGRPMVQSGLQPNFPPFISRVRRLFRHRLSAEG